MALLSKSDFKVASDCITKLYYKKTGYPSTNDENDYLQFLADGGHQVGKLATLQYPNGIDINTGNDHEEAVRQTEELLGMENVTLLEASIHINNKIIRIDILNKIGSHYELIEVKSKSFDSSIERKKQIKNVEKYIEDVAFQYYVLYEYLYEKGIPFTITPYLCLPDKSKRCIMEGMNSCFRISEAEHSTSRFRAIDVKVDTTRLHEIEQEDLLIQLDITGEVLNLQPEIDRRAQEFLRTLHPSLNRDQNTLTKGCFKCEFNCTNEVNTISGFDVCWQGSTIPEHHVKDLYYSGSLGNNKLVNQMIAENKLSMFDVPEEEIKGKRGQRQKIQLDFTQTQQEWISSGMKDELLKWEYPLHFIDFETATAALPYHTGMRPYESVAFQWSCHTIKTPGAEPEHTEWINISPQFPNFDFAKTLKAQIDGPGTILMWSQHENTILKTIYDQIEVYDYDDQELKGWLLRVAKHGKDDESDLVDMNDFTVKHYFHPFMKGKTSIKNVLPAVLLENSSARVERWLHNFKTGISLLNNENNRITDPYKQLPILALFEKAEQLKDGGGAMSAYQDILFGAHKDDQTTIEVYKEGLLNYCKLDTLAMVIIWEHWQTKCNS
jgi:hypothetical protein